MIQVKCQYYGWTFILEIAYFLSRQVQTAYFSLIIVKKKWNKKWKNKKIHVFLFIFSFPDTALAIWAAFHLLTVRVAEAIAATTIWVPESRAWPRRYPNTELCSSANQASGKPRWSRSLWLLSTWTRTTRP